MMSWNGVGNQEWWGYNPPKFKKLFIMNRFLVYTCAPTLFISQIAYFYLHYEELTFNIRGIMFAIIPVNGLVNLIIVSSKQKSFENLSKNFMSKIHLYNFLGQNEYVKSRLAKAEKNTRRASYFIGFFLMMDWFAWCTITAFNNYYKNKYLILNKSAPLETIIYQVLPFDYQFNYQYWLIVHISNMYLVWSGCIIIIVHNSINYAYVFQLIGHIEILKHKLKNYFTGQLCQEEVREKLIDVIKYHAFLLKLFKDIQSAFGFNVFTNYLYNWIADSLLLYQMMMGDKGDLPIYGLMIVAYMGALIVMSFVLEEIRRQSDTLPDYAYNIDWENMSVPNRKIYLQLLMRIQPALVFEATGGLKAGVRPMTSIIKSTFSYYVMLKSSMKT